MDALTASAALSSLWQSLADKLHDNPRQPIIVQIGSESSPDQVPKPDLEDDQKRWLIVGICLHSVISPALRQYVPQTVSQLYNSLVRKNQINTQSFQNFMKTYKSKDLNYEAINNNSAVPRVKGKPAIAKYDYAVKSDVEFSKLFLQTSMTHYSGFDSSCDSSALLGIVINMDFPPNLKTVAEQVRRNVRNPWAHCNISEWDVIKFQSSFQLMYQLVKNLQFPVSEETAVLGTLTEWHTNGIQFLQGTTIGMELLQKLKTETHTLSKYLLEVVGHTDGCIRESHQAIVRIDQKLNATHNLVNELKTESQKLKADMDNVSIEVGQLQTSQTQLRSVIEESNKDLTILQAKTKDFENQKVVDKQYIDEMKADLTSVRFDQKEASEDIKEIKTEILYNRKDIQEIKVDVEKNRNEIHETKSRSDKIESDILQTKKDVMKNKDDISKLSQHMSSSRVSRSELFFVPDRVPCFAARKEEIERIHVEFKRMSSRHHTQVICGLGGIGKTTLAVEFAWLYQTCYPAGIFWMSAETNDALEDSIQRLSIQIDKMGSDKKETLHKVLNWLSLLQEQWLLIVDNVDEDELCWAAKEIVHGSWKRSSKGHVIITSRRKSAEADSDFHVTSDQCITLDVLSMSESKQFMISRSGESDDKNDSSLDTLVSELGGLPLALEQASAHIKALKCTYKHYLEKFEKKRLKFMQKSKSPIDVLQERRTVLTTWHLNFDLIAKQSKDEGLGTAAVTAMKVSAYLYADDIPQNIFNVGSPKVCDDDILESLQEDVGANQISAILSRFSLFQETGPNTLSVHRVVQEVVREDLTDINEKKFILECAVRMVNKALESTNSPLEAIREKQIGRTPLLLWSKLCLHANTVRKHLFDFAQQNTRYSSICFNTETSRLLQASSIYHSLNQRQDEALACQDQMLSILPALNISESTTKDFTCIKIPLLNSDRIIIQGNLIANNMTTDETNTAVLPDPETLRLEGNNAFKLHKYHTAIQYYSEAVRVSCRVDPRVLSNRSLAYLNVCDYENALKDADRCISEYQNDMSATGIMTVMYKAYLWKAYAIANLIRLGQLHERYEFVGLASAAVAGHLNNKCLLEYKMKIEYPIVKFKIIKSEKEFAEEMLSPHNMVYTTLLLLRGHYELPSTVQILKSIQVIGIEIGVKIVSPICILLIRPERSWFSSDIYVEPELNIHFENVSFPNEAGHVFVGEKVNATFYRCKFSNGRKACENFPVCKGNVGCVNSSSGLCREKYKYQEKVQERIVCGKVGSSGLAQEGRSYVVVDSCIFDRCGGGGTCCEGEGAKMVIKNSILQNMRQMGVQARHGGTVEVERCTIINNQFHGVAIGPRGFGKVENCIIRGNNEEGIWCGGVQNVKWEARSIKTVMNPNEGSVCIIKGNLISQNGLSGLTFNGGSYEVSGNRIFDNWLWGMMMKSRSATSIYNNDIFENKCGGIRIGVNYSAPVVVDGNTIRDHIGPAIHIEGTTIQMDLLQSNYSSIVLEGEINYYSISPFITTRNSCPNNNCGHRHPTELLIPVQTCCYCHNISNNLQRCGRCKKATYCSKDCQTSHWKRHKNLCTIFQESYIVEIDLSKAVHVSENSDRNDLLAINTTTIPLPDLGKGNPPDKKSSRKFIVKIQSGKEYTRYDPTKMIRIYDQTQRVFEEVRQSKLYHLVNECGVLAGTRFTTKKIYCWASFKNKGSILCIHTDNLPPFQDRW